MYCAEIRTRGNGRSGECICISKATVVNGEGMRRVAELFWEYG